MRAADSDALLNLAVLDAPWIALVLHTQRAAPDASTCCQQIVPMANAVAQTIITFMQELQQDNDSMLQLFLHSVELCFASQRKYGVTAIHDIAHGDVPIATAVAFLSIITFMKQLLQANSSMLQLFPRSVALCFASQRAYDVTVVRSAIHEPLLRYDLAAQRPADAAVASIIQQLCSLHATSVSALAETVLPPSYAQLCDTALLLYYASSMPFVLELSPQYVAATLHSCMGVCSSPSLPLAQPLQAVLRMLTLLDKPGGHLMLSLPSGYAISSYHLLSPSAAPRFAGRGGMGVKGAEATGATRTMTATTCMNLRGGGGVNQAVRFLIDGATSFTMVNNINLLEPESIEYVTDTHKTARAGSVVVTTARGIIRRMWQLRNESWVCFALPALFSAELDENVVAESHLYNELHLVADKFVRVALVPANATNALSDVPLSELSGVCYVHTIAVPTTDEESFSRVNFAVTVRPGPCLASSAPRPDKQPYKRPLGRAPHSRYGRGVCTWNNVDGVWDDPNEGRTIDSTEELPMHVHRIGSGKWLAKPYCGQISLGGTLHHVGIFADPIEAAVAVADYKLLHAPHKAPRALPMYVHQTKHGTFIGKFRANGSQRSAGTFTDAQACARAVAAARRAYGLDVSYASVDTAPDTCNSLTELDVAPGTLPDSVDFVDTAPDTCNSLTELDVAPGTLHDSVESMKAAKLIELAGGHRSLLNGWTCVFTSNADEFYGKFISPFISPTDGGGIRFRTSDFAKVLKHFKLSLPTDWRQRLACSPPALISADAHGAPVAVDSVDFDSQLHAFISALPEAVPTAPALVANLVADHGGSEPDVQQAPSANLMADHGGSEPDVQQAPSAHAATRGQHLLSNMLAGAHAATRGQHLQHLLSSSPATIGGSPATIGDGVEVQASLIPGAGRGLFAQRSFRKGQVITLYDGQKLSDRFAAARCFPQTHINHCSRTYHGRHGGQHGNDIYIDGIRDPEAGCGGGSFANHKQYKRDCNADFTIVLNDVYLTATCNISAAEEIYVYCGNGDVDIMMGKKRMVIRENIDGVLSIHTVAVDESIALQISASTATISHSDLATATKLVVAHGGHASHLVGWTCELGRHPGSGLFVNPDGTRFRHVDSVFRSLGLPRQSLQAQMANTGYATAQLATPDANACFRRIYEMILASSDYFPSVEPAPQDGRMGYRPIFQGYPNLNRKDDCNIGDGLRLQCAGLPKGSHVHWCRAAADFHLQIASDMQLTLDAPYDIVENSILFTRPHATDQVGHFDLQVDCSPSGESLPYAVIFVTALDMDSSLRILPIGVVDGMPTSPEFDALAVRVPIPKGCTVVMRCDVAHSGTKSPGKRIHTIIGPKGATSLGNTYFLPRSA